MMQNVNELRRRYASGMVKTEAGNEVSLEELNFEKCIIGSDEAGKGEIFRPLITAAACVRPENMEKLLGLGVKDSKAYGKDYEKLWQKILKQTILIYLPVREYAILYSNEGVENAQNIS